MEHNLEKFYQLNLCICHQRYQHLLEQLLNLEIAILGNL